MDFHRARRFITAAVLLLAPAAASAQVRDGNLIEYGMGGFADGGIGSPMLFPQRGPYPRLLHRFREEIPSTYSSFRAHQLTFRLYPGSTWREPVAWPFSVATPLAGSSGSITLTDPAAVAFVLDHSFGGFSWLQTNVRENGTDYEIITESVPGWFDPQHLAEKLWMMRMDARQ